MFVKLMLSRPGKSSGATTVTSQVPVTPFALVALMVTVPGAIPLIWPFTETVAMVSSSEVHATVVSVAFSGITFATRVSVTEVVTGIVIAAGAITISVTATASSTVTAITSVKPPSTVVTVMFAVPGATPVTRPLALTVAISVLSLAKVTFLFAASAGRTVHSS